MIGELITTPNMRETYTYTSNGASQLMGRSSTSVGRKSVCIFLIANDEIVWYHGSEADTLAKLSCIGTTITTIVEMIKA